MTWHGIPIPYTDRDDWLTRRRVRVRWLPIESVDTGGLL